MIAANNNDFAVVLSLDPCVIQFFFSVRTELIYKLSADLRIQIRGILILDNFSLYHYFSLDNDISDFETLSCFNFCIYNKMLEQMSSSLS